MFFFRQSITTSFAEMKSMSMETISPRVAIEGVTTLSGSKPNLNIPIASRAATIERIIPDVKAEITQIRVSLRTGTFEAQGKGHKVPQNPENYGNNNTQDKGTIDIIHEFGITPVKVCNQPKVNCTAKP